jgi:hypothetical protein
MSTQAQQGGSVSLMVTYRGRPVRFTYQAGKRIFEVVQRERATPFANEADAWLEARKHGLPAEHTVVETAQKRNHE